MHLFASLLVTALAIGLSNGQLVQLKAGKVQGKVEHLNTTSSVNVFQGIRFGHAKRFAKPTPVEAWTDTYQATSFGNRCPQFDGHVHTQTENEDCLFLNVWQPSEGGSNRSVMVWIHGGGFTIGSSNQYDSRYLTHDGQVVVVTINYRLGPLGFLYDGEEGNFGLYDQVLALQWVKDNIAQFGGNPADVTIFGESAGGWSVGAQIISPLAKGLFHRAIMQSGAVETAVESKAEALKHTQAFATKLNCPHDRAAMIECLRGKPLADLKTSMDLKRPIIYGDDFMPTKPVQALQTGHYNHVDLLFGVTDNDGASFNYALVANPHTTHDVQAAVTKLLGPAAGALVQAHYLTKLGANPTPDELKATVAKIVSDGNFDCPSVLFAELAMKLAPQQKYFSYRLMESTEHSVVEWKSVLHAADLPFLFSPSHHKHPLSPEMIRAWTQFAKTGVPGKMGGFTDWTEAFGADHKSPVQFMALHSGAFKMVANYYVETCDAFWNPLLKMI